MSDLCDCFPPPGDLAVMAGMAQSGRPEPFVGTGDPDTRLTCGHGTWRLGDVTTPPAPSCGGTRKDGQPCQGAPGQDGFCAAHKQKGDGGATGDLPPVVVGADPPQEDGQGEESGQEASGPQGGGKAGQQQAG